VFPVVTGTGSTTSVKFSWVAIDHAESYSYSINDGVTWTTTNQTEITLDGLGPGTSHTISVKAIAAAESNYRDSEAGEGSVSTNS